ncbi:endospore germination permease [Paenibacillus chartarius]|uniref:Endospore germination permease n=1 Tax=Paenibacillus chartarius TaxID=747481 RepID=A0ABV6DQQ4_9BACL
MKINASQMAVIMHPAISSTALLSAPAIIARHADRDMWLSPLWGSLIGMLSVYIACRLNRLYPSETAIQYYERILGKFAGKLLGLVFLMFLLHITGIIIRQYGEFVVSTFLTETPIVVIIVSMMIVCAYAVRCGLETIARSAQIIVPVVGLLFIVIVAMLIPDMKVTKLLPMLENGLWPSLKGALFPAAWFSEFTLVSFLLPHISDRQHAWKWGLASVVSVSFIFILTAASSLMLFGGITSALPYPVLLLARYISLADFLSHVESIVMAIWVAGLFIKITFFYYILAAGTAQWLDMTDHRPLVMPLALLLVVFSLWSGKSFGEISLFLATAAPFYVMLMLVLVPLLLLAIALLRKHFAAGKGVPE